MKKVFIVANWKSNKDESEAKDWLDGFKIQNLELINKEIIICPPFTLLSQVASEVISRKLKVKVGAQNISPFDGGAYTGEINGKQIKEFVDYVIIGHSERRQNFSETDETLFRKVDQALKYDLTPIFCVQGKETKVPPNVAIVAYEPIDAIGTGQSDTAENAEEVASFFKKNYNVQYTLYGGSITSKNVKEFTQMPNIDGVLIGGASLDVKEFYAIIQNA